jgi:retron-type reverse transcriptase
MPVERAGSSLGGQGKAVPVEGTALQLQLPIATAENPRGATRRTTRVRLGAVRAGVPKAIVNEETAMSATMEEVAKRLTSALLKVASNEGAPGPDGQTIEALLEQWLVVLPKLQADLLAGMYRPGEIRRAYIPKAGGGQRGLGIPDVVDRVVQEAVRQVLEPLWEPTFHPSNHGFRPGRSCHTAINEAKQHLQDGYEWVVDLDLEKFFDLVCHQRLTAKLAERVGDRRLLVLIGRMLKAKVVLPDGVVIDTEEGVPQGGPLSPLLSNIVLDELDRELSRRGHRFVRYADDGVPRTLKEDRCRRRYRRMRCCMRDGGWPSAVALQGEIANHREVRRSRAGVLSVAEKARRRARQVWITKASESEPPLKCRKRIDDIQNRGRVIAPGRVWREPADWPGGCPAWMVARAWSGLLCGTREPVAPMGRPASGAVLACGWSSGARTPSSRSARGRVAMRGTGADLTVVAVKAL